MAPEAMGLLQTQCLGCHNSEKRKGGLDMSTREHLMAGAEGKAVVDAVKAEEKFTKADSDKSGSLNPAEFETTRAARKAKASCVCQPKNDDGD